MIPDFSCMRTYTVLMLKEFNRVKNQNNDSLSDLQFLSCFLACCYPNEYERLNF